MAALRSPSFQGRQPASAVSSGIKKRVRAKDTTPELLLRRAVWGQGLRYRLHGRDLPGRPDLVFTRARVAVFCDGDFWHGRDWAQRRRRLRAGANASYWLDKIRSNRARDRRVNRALTALGWVVLRFWETDIKADPERYARQVARAVTRKAV